MHIQIPVNTIYCTIRNYNYHNIYNNLLNTLGDNSIFTPMSAGEGYLQWDLPEGAWQPITNADPIEMDLIKELLSAKEAEIRGEIEGQLLIDIYDKICTIPEDKYIYYLGNENGEYQIKLTAWGYRYPERGRHVMGGDSIINDNRQEVFISFTHNEEVIPNSQFSVVLNKDKNRRLNTGATGRMLLARLPAGAVYPIIAMPSQQQFNLVVENGKSEYVYETSAPEPAPEPEPDDCTPYIKVVDNEDMIAEDYTIVVTIEENSRSYVTDKDGIVRPELTLKAGSCMRVEDGNHSDNSETFTLDANQEEYIFHVWPQPKTSIVIYVRHEGESVEGEECSIEVNGRSYDGFTNAEGYYGIDGIDFIAGSSCRAGACGTTQEKAVQQPTTEFVFEQEPDDCTPYIKVVDNEDMIAEDYPIVVTIEENSRSYVTNEDGIVRPELTLKAGSCMRVEDGNHPDNSETFILEANQDEYIFHIPSMDKNDIKVWIVDSNDLPLRTGTINFSQKGHEDTLCSPDDEGVVYLSSAQYETGQPLTAQLSVEKREFEPAIMYLEADEKEYKLQVNGKSSHFWLKILEFILFIAAFYALAIIYYELVVLLNGI